MRRANRLETTSADFETRERKYLDRVYGKMAAKGYPNPKGKLLKTYRCPKCADNQPPFLKKYELITHMERDHSIPDQEEKKKYFTLRAEREGVKCTSCGETKPIEDYEKNPASQIGHRHVCKRCRAGQKKRRKSSLPAREECARRQNAARQAAYRKRHTERSQTPEELEQARKKSAARKASYRKRRAEEAARRAREIEQRGEPSYGHCEVRDTLLDDNDEPRDPDDYYDPEATEGSQ